MRFFRFSAIIFVLLFTSFSFAQKDVVQKIDFEGLDVDGEIRRPDGTFILQKSSVDFLPIYEVKTEMQTEIEKSVYFLR